MTRPTLLDAARRIAPLAWPVFVGQVAVLAFSTVDTLMVARVGALDLAALAIGASAYISIFIGLMGVVLAVGPISGQLFGGGRFRECGETLRQAIWLALGLSVVGCALLLFPRPFLELAHAPPEVAGKVRSYLAGLAFALPPALLFTAYRGFNIALSRPRAVMVLQLGALVVKVPLTALFVFGVDLPAPLAGLAIPALGAPGCGIATAIVMALQMLAAGWMLRRDPFYAPFELGGGIGRPRRAEIGALLRLGIPMGGSILIEVTGFTFMAFFVSRIGTSAVAGHQITVNVVALIFMLPLAIANAASTLVAQRVGAGDHRDARRLAWHSLELGTLIALGVAASVFVLRDPITRLYTSDPVIVAAALPLLAWAALFHLADAAQTIAAFVLRAYRIATVPLVVYAVAIWGVGLGGGYALVFGGIAGVPAWLHGARGFWVAATAGLFIAAFGMAGYLARLLRRQRAARVEAPATAA
ncbi:MATE family efflux transporter [Piscinibacter koreensis]|uniref:MATE family efflux transporter n=1 Tax=Piscinibacter koreensis TaxID=2742824 RepID=A0A7Y6NQ44_9BURK|nr:MATE family efflux transporter [Schlegelella koreensis]NUZ07245.1 MATE family efflux transporter [Schlegelella koreensis]